MKENKVMATKEFLVDKDKKLREEIRKPKCHYIIKHGKKHFLNFIAPSSNDGHCDGNCTFIAVALCLTNLGKGDYDHETVGRETVVYLTTHPKTLDGKPRWDLLTGDSRYQSWNKFLNAMNKDGEPGNNHVCLMALRELYQVNMQIVDARGPKFDKFLETDSNWPTKMNFIMRQ